MSDASHKSVPEWASKRAYELTYNGQVRFDNHRDWLISRTATAFARYIAEHEEAPVDPLEVEFNKWIETYCGRFDPESTCMRFTANEMRKAFMGGAKLAGEQK